MQRRLCVCSESPNSLCIFCNLIGCPGWDTNSQLQHHLGQGDIQDLFPVELIPSEPRAEDFIPGPPAGSEPAPAENPAPPVASEPAPAENPAQRRFRCEICGTTMSRKRDLGRHRRTMHDKSGILHCPHGCGWTSSRSDKFREHMRNKHGLPA